MNLSCKVIHLGFGLHWVGKYLNEIQGLRDQSVDVEFDLVLEISRWCVDLRQLVHLQCPDLGLIVTVEIDLFPDARWYDTWAPIPSIMISWLPTVWIVLRQLEPVFTLKYFFLLHVIISSRIKLNSQIVKSLQFYIDLIPSVHVVTFQNLLIVEKNLAMCVKSLENQLLILWVLLLLAYEEAWTVSCVFGLVFVCT